MSEEVKVIDVNTVEIKELPSIISTQFQKLDILETNVQKAVNMAREAKEKAENAQVDIGLFKYSKKEAINLLQSASEGLAEGLTTAAEAHKVSFEYQTKLTEITKFLFGLGVSNLAMNRSVVRELELKLKGASEEEISDLARQELKNVIIQLKAQEDMMNKQAKLTDKIKKHQEQLLSINKQLDNIGELYNIQDIKIAENIKSILENRKILENQQQKVFEQDNKIVELKKQDKELEQLIETYYKKLLKHDKEFEEQQKKNSKFERKTSNNKDRINDLQNSLKQQEEMLIEKNSILEKKYSYTTKQIKDELCNLSDEINSIDERLINTIIELKEEISNKDNEIYTKITELKDRIDLLDMITSKLGWKIGISIIVAISLMLNILHICGSI